MRGTGYAIAEIIWWMVAAMALGVAIGWILRRWYGGGAGQAELESKLAAESSRYAKVSGELGDWKRRAGSLSGDLESRSAELETEKATAADLRASLASSRAELDDATAISASLESQLADARSELASAAGAGDADDERATALERKDAEIARLASEAAEFAAVRRTLAARGVRVDEVAERLAELSDVRAAHAACGIADEEQAGSIAGMKSTLAERDEKIRQLESRLNDDSSAGNLEAARAEVARLESDLAAVRAENARMAERLVAFEVEAGSSGQATFAELENSSAAAPATWAGGDLEGLAAVDAESAHTMQLAEGSGRMQAPAPTVFGTAGADHSDDLKAISGIGPKMEKLLNSFGIRSWEQLAGLDGDDIAKVDAALTDFPGRIERDEWVRQAKAIVANGHRPVG